MKNVVALEGRSLPPLSADERAVYDLLAQGNGPLSALGLTRWIRKTPDAKKADPKITAAAKKLWHGMLISADDDFGVFIRCPKKESAEVLLRHVQQLVDSFKE